MINPKITIAAAVFAASVVSPAFAQSADHTGSQMPYYYDNTGGQQRGSWGPQDAASNATPVMRSHTLYGYAPARHHRQ